MLRPTHPLLQAAATLGWLTAMACTDAIAPTKTPEAKSFHLELPQKGRSLPNVLELSGSDADTAATTLAGKARAAGNTSFAIDLESSVRRGVLASSRGTAPTSVDVPYADLSGTGTPPEVFNPDAFPRPVILASNVSAGVIGYIASFSSYMAYANATMGQSDLTWNVRGADGSVLYPATTSSFSSIAWGAAVCVMEIMSYYAHPQCDLSGDVNGLVQVSLPRNCDVTASAHALHVATLSLPRPTLSVGPNGWTIGIGPGISAAPATVGNAETGGSGPACEPIRQRRTIEISSDGGEFGGSYIIYFPERQITTRCSLIQERTVQSDGYTGEWYPVGVECYSQFANISASRSPTVAAQSTPDQKSGAVSFTLAGISSPGNKGKATIVRRGQANSAQQPDVIALALDSATPDDLADALRQLGTLNQTDRSTGDATQTVSASSKGKGAGDQKNAYEKVLKELRKAKHSNVDGVGDAATISVIAIP